MTDKHKLYHLYVLWLQNQNHSRVAFQGIDDGEEIKWKLMNTVQKTSKKNIFTNNSDEKKEWCHNVTKLLTVHLFFPTFLLTSYCSQLEWKL